MRTSNFLSTSEGSKYLLCDGSEIPSSYTKLRSLMKHTPDLRDRVPQGAGTYAINTRIEAGIPNIYGRWAADAFGTGVYAPEVIIGAIKSIYLTTGHWASSSMYSYYHTFDIDASRCSSVYKDDCTTVQPPALAVAFYIKAK